MAQVLIVDDDPMVGEVLSQLLRRMGHDPACASCCAHARAQIAAQDFDLVLLDVGLPDGSGLDLLPDVRQSAAAPEVIIITAVGDPDGAELAISSGAWDYIEKPGSTEKVRLQIMRALQYRDERLSAQPISVKRSAIIGSSPQLSACLEVLAQAAASDAPVLISGETGTGKELFATAIHENSVRHAASFVVVDCAALPETLVESALFGYRKGAFTGADHDMTGLIKQADGGTLFLDEIGELPAGMQRAFLRVLQEHRFRPVGAQQEVQSNFRVIAATNRDLASMVSAGTFREDLLYRLQSIIVDIPPLRSRVRDIKEIALHYAQRLCERYGMEVKAFTPEYLEALCAYEWPGNVRELIHTLERSMAAARTDARLYPRHLPAHIRIGIVRKSLQHADTDASEEFSGPLPTLRDYRAQVLAAAERRYLEKLVAQVDGDVDRAGQVSGLSRARLYALLKKHSLSLQF